MHARELVELAALVSVHGPLLIRQRTRISKSSVEQYWTASKSRLDRWGRALKEFGTAADPGPSTECSVACGLLEEILTGEVLTRVWTAVACAYDRLLGTDHIEPVVRSVLIGQLEARHRVLTLLVRGPGIDAEQAVKLNRLRRRTERWTDMLLGYLMGVYDVAEFAVDPGRAREFSEDLSFRGRMQGGRHAWPLVQASLQAAFGQGLGGTSPNPELNDRIATSILSCFPPELFDGSGIPRSAWLMRMASATSDAAGMIDELLALENAPSTAQPSNSPALVRRSERLRRFGQQREDS
jgi:hypothetical protein